MLSPDCTHELFRVSSQVGLAIAKAKGICVFLEFDSQRGIITTISLFMLGKQAKILSDANIRDLLAFTTLTRYPGRNRATDRCNSLTNVYLLAS